MSLKFLKNFKYKFLKKYNLYNFNFFNFQFLLRNYDNFLNLKKNEKWLFNLDNLKAKILFNFFDIIFNLKLEKSENQTINDKKFLNLKTLFKRKKDLKINKNLIKKNIIKNAKIIRGKKKRFKNLLKKKRKKKLKGFLLNKKKDLFYKNLSFKFSRKDINVLYSRLFISNFKSKTKIFASKYRLSKLRNSGKIIIKQKVMNHSAKDFKELLIFKNFFTDLNLKQWFRFFSGIYVFHLFEKNPKIKTNWFLRKYLFVTFNKKNKIYKFYKKDNSKKKNLFLNWFLFFIKNKKNRKPILDFYNYANNYYLKDKNIKNLSYKKKYRFGNLGNREPLDLVLNFKSGGLINNDINLQILNSKKIIKENYKDNIIVDNFQDDLNPFFSKKLFFKQNFEDFGHMENDKVNEMIYKQKGEEDEEDGENKLNTENFLEERNNQKIYGNIRAIKGNDTLFEKYLRYRKITKNLNIRKFFVKKKILKNVNTKQFIIFKKLNNHFFQLFLKNKFINFWKNKNLTSFFFFFLNFIKFILLNIIFIFYFYVILN